MPPRFDPAAIGVPSLAEYWMGLLVMGLGAHLVRACDRGRHVTVHTAGVALGREGPGILLTGESGAGKSTVAGGLQRLGWYWATGDTTRVERSAAAPTGWMLTPWWPVKLDFSRPGTKWPTFHPAGPSYLRDPVPLGVVYALLTRRRSARGAHRARFGPGRGAPALRRADVQAAAPPGPGSARRRGRRGGLGAGTAPRPIPSSVLSNAHPTRRRRVIAEHAQRILGAAPGC